MNEITLHDRWLVKAPREDVFRIMTDFEKFPENFPKVAESIRIKKKGRERLGDRSDREVIR